MKGYLAIFLSFFVSSALANSFPIILEKPRINVNDQVAVERGAKIYAQQCLVCHSLKYMTHDKVAKKAGITRDNMSDKEQEWWLGAAPPDLSMVARVRGIDWIYTFLYSFYEDPSRPTQTNNLLMKNTSMPNPFSGLQGKQVLTIDKAKSMAGHDLEPMRWFSALRLVDQGSMSADEFNAMINDLSTFLAYSGEPAKQQHHRVGWWVLGFLSILLILTYLLMKEYWKDID